MMPYGYDGQSSVRVVAISQFGRKVLAWGDDITPEEIKPFEEAFPLARIVVEPVTDKAAESLTFPLYDPIDPADIPY